VVTFQSVGEKCPYPSLYLGDSDSVKQTDQIYISGFPDRVGGGKLVRQFVRGSVSGLDVLEQGYGISYDASTFGGMSGGPVLDTSGKVVAVHGKTDAQIVEDLQSQQASLSLQQQAALQQAAARVAGRGVQVNTFRWGIPIKTYWHSSLGQPIKESLCQQDWDGRIWKLGIWFCGQEWGKAWMYGRSGERGVLWQVAWLDGVWMVWLGRIVDSEWFPEWLRLIRQVMESNWLPGLGLFFWFLALGVMWDALERVWYEIRWWWHKLQNED
jgi:hypothetical protein